MLEKLKQLLELGGVSGQEEPVIEFLAAQLSDCCRTSTDAMGNLIAHKSGHGKRIMLTASADVPGLIVTWAQPDAVGVQVIGALEPKQYVSKHVRLSDGTRALVQCEKQDGAIKSEDLSLELLGQAVQASQTASLFSELAQGEQGILAGPYLSSRASCAVLWEVLQRADSPYDLYGVFSVQGQLGHRGAGPAAAAVEPDMAIVLQSCEADGQQIRLGRGPVICQADRKAIFHQQAKQWLAQAAKRAQIPVQTLVDEATSGAAGVVMHTASGIVTGCIEYAVAERNTAAESVCKQDLEQCVSLLLHGLEE